MYRYNFNNYDINTLTLFSTITYKKFKAESVPKELTVFDDLLENITNELKVNLKSIIVLLKYIFFNFY